MFGSALRTLSPRDIDLLIVYSPEKMTVQEVITLKNEIKINIENVLSKSIHICTLTIKEATESRFIEEEECIKVFNAS